MAKYSNLATVQIFKNDNVEKIGKVEEVFSAVEIKEKYQTADLSSLENLNKFSQSKDPDEGMSL